MMAMVLCCLSLGFTKLQGDLCCMKMSQGYYYEVDSNSLVKANYQGSQRIFEFSTYVFIHQKTHEELAHFGNQCQE